MSDGIAAGRTWTAWLTRGAVGGVAAGIAFLAVTMWFATSVGDPAKGPVLMISTILEGKDAMMTGTASVGVGLAVHLALSALFGGAFAASAWRVRTNGALAAAGVAYGAALYVLNFKVLSPLAFPVFKMANQPFELVVHVVFGSLVALALFGAPRLGDGSTRRAEEAHDPARAGARSL